MQRQNPPGAQKLNLAATTDPGVSNDTTEGYVVGSRWINVSTDEEFVCVDASTGAAVWSSTTSGGGGGVTDHGALTGLGDDDHTQYLLANGTRTLTGNLTVTGTVDGRDVATDGTKLDGIETGATADQVASEVPFTPAGDIAATDVQGAITELDTEKAATGHTHANASASGAGFLPQSNFAATTNPGSTDDTNAGYAVGSVWVNTAGQSVWVCRDATATAALWDRVDNVLGSVFGRTGAVTAQASDYDADQVDFTPTGDIVATDVQAAIAELDAEKAATAHTIASHSDTTATGAELEELTDGSTTTLHNHAHANESEGEDLHAVTSPTARGFFPRSNFAAVADPTVNDDTGDGYQVGSLWVNTSSDSVFQCADASAGAAVWQRLDNVAGGTSQINVQEEGTTVATEDTVNFVSPFITVTDGGTRADVTGPTAGVAAVGLDGDTASAEGSNTTVARSDHAHAIDTATGTISTVNAGDAATEGSGAGLSRRDHQHAVATAAPSNVGTANAEGASTSLARADHVHAHGAQTDGTLHALASASAAGFLPQSNLAATTDPTTGDDTLDGYLVGSLWINVTADTAWICLDATAAAAVWTEITQSGGGSSDHGALTGLADDDHTQYLLVDGTRAMTGDLDMGAQALENRAFNVLTEALGASTNNDWSPTNWSTADEVRVNATGSVVFTGFDATATTLVKRLRNVGSGTITIRDQDAGSAAANRCDCPISQDIILRNNETVLLVRDATDSRWSVAVFSHLKGPNFATTANAVAVFSNTTGGLIEDRPSLIATFGGQLGLGGTPTTDAQLDLQQTDGALYLPRLTTTQRDALTPQNGFAIYNTTANEFQVYENGAWSSITGGGVTDHGALTGLADDDHTQYLLADGTRTLSGNLVITGTVDGRDVAADGTKLDGIEAAADVTDAVNVAAAGALMADGSVPATGDLDLGSQALINRALNEISPTALAAQADDWAPTGMSAADYVRVTLTGSQTVTGISGANVRRKWIKNIDGVDTLTLAHESASSAVANRFDCPEGVDVAIPPGGVATIIRDTTANRWAVLLPDDISKARTPTSHGSTHDPGGADAVTTAAATTVSATTGNNEGAAASLARSDHGHNIATGAASTLDADSTNTEGAGANIARAAHTHAITTGAPSATLDGDSVNAEGSSAGFARADHTHALAIADATAAGLLPQSNLAASTDPGVGDDTVDGYVVGSLWINTTSDEAFVCLDNSTGAAVWTSITAAAAASDHGGLTGLTDDDHSQYALLAGRAGGQTLQGGSASGNDLTLESTSNATKGRIIALDDAELRGQVRVGASGAPGTSMALDIVSTTGALMPPRMTTTQRNALTAAAGMAIWNTTTGTLEVYDGSAWQDALGGGGATFEQRDILLWDDMVLNAGAPASDRWNRSQTGTGANAGRSARVAGAPGVYEMDAGNAGGRAAISIGTSDTGTHPFGDIGSTASPSGGDPFLFETLIRFTNGVGTDFWDHIIIGWADDFTEGTASNPTDVIAIEYDPGENAQFAVRLSSGGTTTRSASSTTPVTNTWYRLGLYVEPNGGSPRASLYVNGTQEGSTISTNWPTTASTVGYRCIGSGVDASEAHMQIDYCLIERNGDPAQGAR